jgi:phosphoglycolate phosphatase
MGRRKYQGRRAAAFIFDLDGTLIDSGLDIALAGNFARVHFELPPLAVDQLISFVGDGLPMFMERTLGHDGVPVSEEQLAEGIAVFRDHYWRHCLDNTSAFPGVLEILAHYRRFPLMVATNKPRRFTERILQGLHLAEAFRRIVTADDVAQRKPDPAILQACLEGLDVAAAEVVVVGDHPVDTQAAHAIGAVSVAVTYGMTPSGQLRAAGPDLMIDHIRELADLFPSRE